MASLTLENILKTQDMGKAAIDKVTEAVLNDTFDANADPLTGILVNLFNSDQDYGSMTTDLEYAIDMLTRAKNRIEAFL